jgi:hypothetical protein
MPTIDEMKEAYALHKNLKVAAAALGIHLQTLYWHLRKAGVTCAGDKEMHGSEKDRFGAKAEALFLHLVPSAVNQNELQFQSKVDFVVGDIRVEVKAAKRQPLGKGAGGDRWMFSIKKQLTEADFFVMLAFSQTGDFERAFVIPAELIASKTTISISVEGRSKWHAYQVEPGKMADLFTQMRAAA